MGNVNFLSAQATPVAVDLTFHMAINSYVRPRVSPLRLTCSKFGGQGRKSLPEDESDWCALRANTCGVINSPFDHNKADDSYVSTDMRTMPLSQTVLRSNGFLRSSGAAISSAGYTEHFKGFISLNLLWE